MLAAIVMLAMCAVQFAVMQGDSQANDESFHLLTGYRYLKTGSLSLGCEHPPLAQLVAATPLLALNLRLPGPHAEAGDRAQAAQEREFLYGNTYPADTILRWARSAALVWLVLLGWLIAWWTRRHFGPVPALVALLLLASDPAFLAHGHYTDNDVPVTLCFLAAVLSWNKFLQSGRTSGAVLCGVLSGVAISTKYSSLLLFPMYVLLYGLSWWRQSGDFRHSWGHLTKNMAVLLGTMFLAVFAIFHFEFRPLIPMELMENPEPVSVKILKHKELLGGLAPAILSHPDRLRLLDTLLQHTPVPAASFFRGLFLIMRHSSGERSTYYLLGKYSERGWWYYFPVVMAVKTPTATILLFLLAVAMATQVLLRDGWRAAAGKLARCSPDWYALTVPPLFYFLVSLESHINIGIRHVLPMYPFIFIWMAAVLFSLSRVTVPNWVRGAAVACMALGMAETAMEVPNYLGFFNVASGGPRVGLNYVVDSNLDWGQDLKRLKTYLASHRVTNPCLSSFGIGQPEDYGIIWQPVPDSLEEAQRLGCVVVMSNTQFEFDGGKRRHYWWLRNLTPTDFVGSSFRVFQLPGSPRSGRPGRVPRIYLVAGPIVNLHIIAAKPVDIPVHFR
jgi:4-amino-4-deoxy-L-arabinose transferase-like glycosyltransferase